MFRVRVTEAHWVEQVFARVVSVAAPDPRAHVEGEHVQLVREAFALKR